MLESCRAGWEQRTCTGRLEDREFLWSFWEDCCYALCCLCVRVYTFVMIIRCLAHILKCLHDLHDCVQDLEGKDVITLHLTAVHPYSSIIFHYHFLSWPLVGSLGPSEPHLPKESLNRSWSFLQLEENLKSRKLPKTYMCSKKKNDFILKKTYKQLISEQRTMEHKHVRAAVWLHFMNKYEYHLNISWVTTENT